MREKKGKVTKIS